MNVVVSLLTLNSLALFVILVGLIRLSRKTQNVQVRTVSVLNTDNVLDAIDCRAGERAVVSIVKGTQEQQSEPGGRKRRLEHIAACTYEEWKQAEQYSVGLDSMWYGMFDQMCFVLKDLYPATYPANMVVDGEWFAQIRARYSNETWKIRK